MDWILAWDVEALVHWNVIRRIDDHLCVNVDCNVG